MVQVSPFLVIINFVSFGEVVVFVDVGAVVIVVIPQRFFKVLTPFTYSSRSKINLHYLFLLEGCLGCRCGHSPCEP